MHCSAPAFGVKKASLSQCSLNKLWTETATAKFGSIVSMALSCTSTSLSVKLQEAASAMEALLASSRMMLVAVQIVVAVEEEQQTSHNDHWNGDKQVIHAQNICPPPYLHKLKFWSGPPQQSHSQRCPLGRIFPSPLPKPYNPLKP